MPKNATHMLRSELFDLSDLLNRLTETVEAVLPGAAIKVRFGMITVADENNERLGTIKFDGEEFVFVPVPMTGKL